MPPFLENVANYIYKNHRDELGESVLVFPGRRAAVFFKKHLLSITDRPIWAPRLLTMADFFKELSDITVVDELKLLFELYNIYISKTGTDETFDRFYFWGGMMLNDFDDIDKYLVDARQLFKNVESLKDIETHFEGIQPEEMEIIKQFWTNFNPTVTSFHKEEFVKIWKVLYDIYLEFRKTLSGYSQGYEGMVFRDVAEKINSKGLGTFPWKRVFFIGHNALTSSEKYVMEALQRNGKAEFFWDYDEFYLDAVHEAGLFLRENIKNFHSPDFENSVNNIRNIPKKIRVLSVASNIGQAKNLYRAFGNEDIGNDPERIDSCIVLADENLLVPTLYSIPREIDKVNVTMGFPLNASTVFHFIGLLTELQQSIKGKNADSSVFYHQPIMSLLNHPYFSFWENNIHNIKRNILSKNKVYVSLKDLQKNSFLGAVFQKIDDTGSFARYLMDVLYAIYMEMSNSESTERYYDIEKEFIYRAYLIVKRLDDILSEMKLVVELPTYLKMLRKALQSGKVNFIGEPLAGLQVMGALETRGIDFPNLAIVSMNEGVFPKKTTAQSFIPYNLRRAFGLPTYEHQDAIYAYYFYRLIQRAENVTIFYNSNSDGVNGGEMSRFIYQLKYDSPMHVEFESIDYKIKGVSPVPISVESNPNTATAMERYIEGKGKAYLSPSAINYFKNCTLRFYFRYIAGLKEPDEVMEDVDYALFGNILHDALKRIYERCGSDEIDESVLNHVLKDNKIIEQAIDSAFVQEYMNGEGSGKKIAYKGKNSIIKEVIKKYIRKLIEIDKKSTPFHIVSLEKKYETTVPLFEGKYHIKLGGKIDRVDDTGGMYRIIDYKTGNKKNVFKSVEDLFSPEKAGEGDVVLQVFLYALLFGDNCDEKKPMLPALMFMREIYDDKFSINIEQSLEPRKREKITGFEPFAGEVRKNLTLLLEKMFSDEVTFDQTDDLDYCRTCAYREICHR